MQVLNFCFCLLLAGAYAITDKGSSTRFDYELAIPREPGEVQEEFHIGRAGEYILQVKA